MPAPAALARVAWAPRSLWVCAESAACDALDEPESVLIPLFFADGGDNRELGR